MMSTVSAQIPETSHTVFFLTHLTGNIDKNAQIVIQGALVQVFEATQTVFSDSPYPGRSSIRVKLL